MFDVRCSHFLIRVSWASTVTDRRYNRSTLSALAPLTSQIRGLRGEVEIGKPRWLPKRSAVNVQGLASIDRHGLVRRMGELGGSQLAAVKAALRELLDL